jgi:small subunit ribosomal protein S20
VANIASQKKRNRQNEARRVRNLRVRSELKTRIKSARSAAEHGDEQADAALTIAQKRLGKAAGKGVVHKNQAARRTSRLMKAANRAAADS